MLNIQLDVPESEQGPGMGGAMLAMVACGRYPSVAAACGALGEGVGAQVGLQKQGNAQVGHRQPGQQQDYPEGEFGPAGLFHSCAPFMAAKTSFSAG